MLKTKAHKGSQDNLGKTKDCCEFCHNIWNKQVCQLAA